VCSARSEWWIRQDNVKAIRRRRLVDRISERDYWFDAMEIEIHQGQSSRSGDQILTVVRLGPYPFGDCSIQCTTLCLVEKPLIGRNEKAATATCRVGNRKVCPHNRVRLYTPNDRLNKHSRSKVLSRPLFPLTRCL